MKPTYAAALLTLSACATAGTAPPPATSAAPAAAADTSVAPAGAPASGGLCPAATDPRYGYSKAHPIAVGGGAMGGPPRAYSYLDTLTGPNGQAITFHRNGSMAVDDAILDQYDLKYDGQPKPILLYVDQYHYRELLAPAGLRCSHPFRLDRPTQGLNGMGH